MNNTGTTNGPGIIIFEICNATFHKYTQNILTETNTVVIISVE